MKSKIRKALFSPVDPLLFMFACVMLGGVLTAATGLASQVLFVVENNMEIVQAIDAAQLHHLR
ncbi:MAG TPA: hypothetical protein VLT36_13020 [Candidatus Dormibacteraeota bacterium]|nr:hypothetical protein [Candidatus Dormibacteraeota bacterium]